jgi:hypothetical protein
MEGQNQKSPGKQNCDGLSDFLHDPTRRRASTFEACVVYCQEILAGLGTYLSRVRSRLIVAASALKKPLTVFSSSSP